MDAILNAIEADVDINFVEVVDNYLPPEEKKSKSKSKAKPKTDEKPVSKYFRKHTTAGTSVVATLVPDQCEAWINEAAPKADFQDPFALDLLAAEFFGNVEEDMTKLLSLREQGRAKLLAWKKIDIDELDRKYHIDADGLPTKELWECERRAKENFERDSGDTHVIMQKKALMLAQFNALRFSKDTSTRDNFAKLILDKVMKDPNMKARHEKNLAKAAELLVNLQTVTTRKAVFYKEALDLFEEANCLAVMHDGWPLTDAEGNTIKQKEGEKMTK